MSGANSGGQQEDAGQHDASDEHAALQPDALVEMRDHRQPLEQGLRLRRLLWLRSCLVPHPGVDQRGDDVHDEVGDGDDDGQQHHDALDGDEVAGVR